MYLLWSIRLAIYLGWRTAHSKEDQRYINIEKRWKKNPKLRMLRFFGIQGIINLILCIPAWFLFHYSAENTSYNSSLFPWLGFGLFIIGWTGETIADLQLALHKRRKVPGSVCNTGLWKYSRHPNYFFEFLIWVSISLFILGLPYGWFSILLPAVMLYLLLYKTGIPETEKHMEASKGEVYTEYQRRTSKFFPLPPLPSQG
jgi:steroid 5-alpha reductase family enzyme